MSSLISPWTIPVALACLLSLILLLRRRTGLAVGLAALTLAAACVVPHVYFPLRFVPAESSGATLAEDAPTAYWMRPGSDDWLTEVAEIYLLRSQTQLPVYEDTNVHSQRVFTLPVGTELTGELPANITSTAKRGWMHIDGKHWQKEAGALDEPAWQGYVRVADLYRLIWRSELTWDRESSIERKCHMRRSIWFFEWRAWEKGYYVSPSLAYAYPPLAQGLAALTLLVTLGAWLRGRKRKPSVPGGREELI